MKDPAPYTTTSLSRIVYGRMELRSLRKLVSSYIAPTVFNRLQSLCILTKRGNRGGYRRSGSGFQSIRSLGNLDGQRESIAYSRSCHVNHANLIQINASHHMQFNHPYRFKYANSANLITVPQKPCLSPPLCSTSKNLHFCLLNTRSIRNKSMAVKDFVVDNDIDTLTMTETWLRPGSNDSVEISTLCPMGYRVIHILILSLLN